MEKNIAIIGTRGAGKTVFTTVLAKRLAMKTPEYCNVQLIPDSYEVDEYVEINYATLQRGEWIMSTNVEQRLSWKLKTMSGNMALNLLDYNGEDFHRLFARKGFEKPTSEKDKELLTYLFSSSIILLLINVQDFLDDSLDDDIVKLKRQRQFALREFLTAIKKEERRVAIVLTAFNRYKDTLIKCYGSGIKDAVGEFFRQKLPVLYDELSENGYTRVFLVSAVADVSEDANGESVPVRNFTSEGLEKLMLWIVDPSEYEKQKQKEKENDSRDTESTVPPRDAKPTDPPVWTPW